MTGVKGKSGGARRGAGRKPDILKVGKKVGVAISYSDGTREKSQIFLVSENDGKVAKLVEQDGDMTLTIFR